MIKYSWEKGHLTTVALAAGAFLQSSMHFLKYFATKHIFLLVCKLKLSKCLQNLQKESVRPMQPQQVGHYTVLELFTGASIIIMLLI